MRYLLISLMLVGAFKAVAQAPDNPSYVWPDDWLGVWKGTLYLYNPGKTETRTFPMTLEILEDSLAGQWQWTIIYGEGEQADVRRYLLIPQDSVSGHFVIDEQNGILLDQYLAGNSMVSLFAVDDAVLFASCRLEGDHLVSEITSGSFESPRVSSLEQEESEKSAIPAPVRSYRLGASQRALLWKQ